MYAHPGKKLIFMGSEFAQWSEWNHEKSIDWHLLQYAPHQGVHQWMKDLNYLYKTETALYERDFVPEGFEWIDLNDYQQGVISFIRKSADNKSQIVAVCNFTPMPWYNYSIGVPEDGFYKEILNSDAANYGGSSQGNLGGQTASKKSFHGRPFSLSLTIPPLGILFLKRENKSIGEKKA